MRECVFFILWRGKTHMVVCLEHFFFCAVQWIQCTPFLFFYILDFFLVVFHLFLRPDASSGCPATKLSNRDKKLLWVEVHMQSGGCKSTATLFFSTFPPRKFGAQFRQATPKQTKNLPKKAIFQNENENLQKKKKKKKKKSKNKGNSKVQKRRDQKRRGGGWREHNFFFLL